MNAAGESFLLLLLFLAASPMLLTQTASAQATPSVPNFTSETHADINVTTITLSIQNQLFDGANYPNDGFFYNVRMRTGGENWSELYNAEDWYPQQSGNKTVLTYTTGENAYYPRETSQGHPAIPPSGKVEFEVQAMIGHRDRGSLEPATMIMPYVFVGIKSDWSPPQTVTIGVESYPTTVLTVTPTPTPGKPDASSWVIISVVVGIVVALMVAVVVIGRRSKEKARKQPPYSDVV